MENAGYERYSFRTNLELRPTKWLTLGTRLNGYLANIDMGQDRVDDVFTYGVASTPGMVLRHDGRFGGMQNPEDDPQANNPLQKLYREIGEKRSAISRHSFWNNYSFERTEYLWLVFIRIDR